MNQDLKKLAQLHDDNIDLKKEIERLKAEREWISVKDRLPEAGIVLAFQNNKVYVSLFDGITKPAFTRWMPLPDKPKQ